MDFRTLYAIGILFLAGAIQFSVGLTDHRVSIIVTGAILGLAPYGLWRLLERSSQVGLNLYVFGAAAAMGIASGGALNWLRQTTEAAKTEAILAGGLALTLGALTCILMILLQQRHQLQSCNICRRPLGRDWHECPRCKYAVCKRQPCWNPSGKRCSDCIRLERPLLALESDAWWTDRVGARLPRGRCSCCDAGAAKADLRECGNCTRAMCIRCWDLENGVCIKCNWVIASLPEPLKLFQGPD